jgi:hypothetical protein
MGNEWTFPNVPLAIRITMDDGTATVFSAINYLAVLAAGIAYFLLGYIWYQIIFRGLVYRELAAKVTAPDLLITFVRGLVMAWALAELMALTGEHSWLGAMSLAVFAWFGFMATAQLSEKLFGGRSWRLYLVNTAYPLASLILSGTILSLWS